MLHFYWKVIPFMKYLKRFVYLYITVSTILMLYMFSFNSSIKPLLLFFPLCQAKMDDI